MNGPEEILLTCTCNCAEHQMIMKFFPDDEEPIVYVDIHLQHYLSLWKRLKYGVRYILGYKSKYGAFDEILLGDKHIQPLERVVAQLKALEAKRLQMKLFND